MPSSTRPITGLCPLRPRALVLALCAAAPLLAQASVAGRFQFVFGEVRVLGLDGQERAARKGQEVQEGETLSTGANASAQLKMIDGGFIAMRPQSQLKLDAYVVQGGAQGQDKALISLVKGGFRSVTGRIGKTHKEDYSVTTPTATIGIRGTDHEPVVIAPPLAGAPQADPPGTYDKVNTGATSLSTPAGTAVIEPNQVGFAGSPAQSPVLLPSMPSFYQSATPPADKGAPVNNSAVRTSAAVDTQLTSATTTATTSTTSTLATSTSTTSTTSTTLPLTGTNSSGSTFNSVTNLTSNKTFSPGPALLLDYSAVSGSSNNFSGYGPELTFTRNSANQITGATLNNLFNRNSYSVSGSTLTDTGQDSGTGLSWGRWQGGQLSQTSSYLGQDSSGQWGFGASTNGQFVIGNTSQNTVNQGSASLHWITAQQAYPQYLPQALTGSATYTLLGGTRPSDSSGNLGTLNSATLSANFTAQTINAGVNFSLGGNAWVVQSNGMPLQNVQFQSSICSTCTVASGVTNTLTKNGVSALSSGSSANLFGQLTGTGLNGAALGYNVSDSSNILLGVAGFSGPTQNTATAFRAGTVNNGFTVNYNTSSTAPQPSLYNGAIDFSEAPASRVVSSSAGLSEFLGTATYLPTGSGTFTTSGNLVTAKIGTAVNRDLGSTTIDTVTVSWGRWEGGAVDIYSVDGLTKIGSISNLNRSMHWVASGTLTSMPSGSLPMTGSATYALAGSTSPTDLLGNVGTLGSVTLNADFGAMRANASVSASFSATGNAATWSMTANGMPIRTTGEFQSSTALSGTSGITHTTSCSGTGCGSQNFSALNGVFVGTGASGAVMSYRFVTGNAGTTSYANLPNNFTPTNAVTGLAVLKK